MVPQLKKLDGNDITPTDKIIASQNFCKNQEELYVKVEENIKFKINNPIDINDDTLFTPQTRITMANETSAHNLEKQKREEEMWGTGQKEPRNLPGILNFRGEIRQCNEGG